jgi:hypothetical protein
MDEWSFDDDVAKTKPADKTVWVNAVESPVAKTCKKKLGTYFSKSLGLCTPCYYGKFAELIDGEPQCRACAVGKFASSAGMTSCMHWYMVDV